MFCPAAYDVPDYGCRTENIDYICHSSIPVQTTGKYQMTMADNDWKRRLNIVYSTNPDFVYDTGGVDEPETVAPAQQRLTVLLDNRNRGGKTVTLVTGFVGTEVDLKELCRLLKNKCGVGGSAKDGEIIIQGKLKEKVAALLVQAGYAKTKVK